MLAPAGMEGVFNPGVHKKVFNHDLEKLLVEAGFDVKEETAKFMDPKTGGNAETRSLLNHVLKNTYVEEDELCKDAARVLADLCRPAQTLIDVDWDSDEAIRAAIQAVDRQSSPGYPFIQTYPGKNNGQIIDMLGEKELVILVRESLKCASQAPTKLFVKWEPHKRAKVENNMERLISSVGLIEQIRDRVIFGPIQKNLQDSYPNIPVATGWADKCGVHHTLLSQFRRKGRKLGLDKGTWDWTVTVFHLMILWYFMRYMHSYTSKAVEMAHLAAIDGHFRLMYGEGHKFINSNGVAFVQLLAGIWKSGGFITLVGNAIMNAGTHIWGLLKMGRSEREIKAYKIAAFGDDTLQDIPDDLDVEEYVNVLRSTGAIIKPDDIDIGDGLDGLEFCGHEIKEIEVELHASPFRSRQTRLCWGLFPTRKGKMLANLLRTDSSDTLDALNSARVNWVNDLDTYTMLTKVAVSWCLDGHGGSGAVKRVLSYSKCNDIMHGYLLGI